MRLATVSVSLVLSLPLLAAACGEDNGSSSPSLGPPMTDTEAPASPQQLRACFEMSGDELEQRVLPYLDAEPPPPVPIPLSYELDDAMDTATVCYDYTLSVTATAATALVRDYDWSIETHPATDQLTLAPGELYALPYVVEVTAEAADRNWSVFGSIYIQNESPFEAIVSGVYESIWQIPVANWCAYPLPHTLRAGEAMSCGYWLKLPSSMADVARVVVATEGRVGPGTTSEPFDFSDPVVSARDECVRVFDAAAGQLGQLCGSGATFDLKTEVGGFAECGEYQWGDTARIETEEWTMGDGWSVAIAVACGNGRFGSN